MRADAHQYMQVTLTVRHIKASTRSTQTWACFLKYDVLKRNYAASEAEHEVRECNDIVQTCCNVQEIRARQQSRKFKMYLHKLLFALAHFILCPIIACSRLDRNAVQVQYCQRLAA